MADDDFTSRLTRIEGMLTMLLRRAELEDDTFALILNVSEVTEAHLAALLRREQVRVDLADMEGEIRSAYRRGYWAGRGSVKRGKGAEPDRSFERRLARRAA